MQRIKVSDNHRSLMKEDGTPFFWLADTAWEMLHHLTLDNIEKYMCKRSEQGFNVMQTVVLAEFDGLKTPTPEGFYPLIKDDNGNYLPECPDLRCNENYFTRMDKVVSMAEKHGFYIALLPTWGDKWNIKWGKGPEIFTEENAYQYGKFLGNRYKNADNIIWIMGGDRPIEKDIHLKIVRSMAKGIKSGGATQLMSYHPCGRTSSSDYVHNETWLDFNMIQSGHGEFITYPEDMIKKDLTLTPEKPVVDGECNYEDHPIAFSSDNGFFDEFDVRRSSYKAVFAGSFGITYGHHSVWSMLQNRDELESHPLNTNKTYFLMTLWDALNRPAANQMKYLKSLIESVSFFDRENADELLSVQYSCINKQIATKGAGYIMVYCPFGFPCYLKIDMPQFTAEWMNPRTGEYTNAAYSKDNGDYKFVPNTAGRNEDYVLVVKF